MLQQVRRQVAVGVALERHEGNGARGQGAGTGGGGGGLERIVDMAIGRPTSVDRRP